MKLFIGALPQSCTTAALTEYFGQFGTIVDAVCMEGRGFGFVTYDSDETAMEVQTFEHEMEGRKLDLKEATVEGTKGAPVKGKGKGGGGGGGFAAFTPWSGGGGSGGNPYASGGGGAPKGGNGGFKGGKGGGKGAGPKTNKIFVGGLPPDCEDEKLNIHFSAYGNLTDVVVMKDRATGKPRGFGFVQFDNTDSADQVMADYEAHQIDGKWIECKRATPQDQMAPQASKGGWGGGGKGGPMMGYGGFGGGYGGGGYGGYAPVGYGQPYGGKGKGKGYAPYK